jgi:hypothetical protein
VGPARASLQPNPITAENALPGSSTWSSGTVAAGGLDGYASEISVLPGAQLHLHVTAPTAVRYRVEVYRLGWYQGLGARLLACLPSCTTDEPAALTPPIAVPDPATGYLDAGWPITDTVAIGANWVSGEYLAKLVLTAGTPAGQVHYIPFVVREATPTSQILVQVGVNTWEAYNNWGGKSLYDFNSTNDQQAYEVSFNRPWVINWNTGPFQFELDAIRFLERNGYDISYATDIDTAQGLDALSARRAVVVIGHDEYWSKEIRDAMDVAQAAGTNMVFLGANTGYWQMRYGNDYRSMFEYRSSALDPNPDPATKTDEFRYLNPPRPECLLEGVQDVDGLSLVTPLDYQVATGALANPWFNGTGFTQSSVVNGVVGYEWDTAQQPGCPPAQILFTWSGQNTYGVPSEADAATFTAASGARVFAAGSLQFSWGLDSYGNPGYANPELQTFTQNMLGDLTSKPVPPSPPADKTSPTIMGTAQPGQALLAANGAWTGSPAPAFTYQWSRCDQSGLNCVMISGATSPAYTVAAGDVGFTLEVTVTGTNGAGAVSGTSSVTLVGPAPALSPPMVAAATSAPSNTSPPLLSGSPVQGGQLATSNGTWSGTPAPAFSYQWLRCDSGGTTCSAISGAMSSSYTVATGDVGSTLAVTVTGSNSAGSASATSSATSMVTAATSPPAAVRLPPSAVQIKAQLLRNLTPGGKASKIAALLRKGACALPFKALSAGTAAIAWYYLPKAGRPRKGRRKPVLVATAHRFFAAAATAKITIKLTTSGEQLLRQVRRLRLTAKGTFTPTGKHAVLATKTFALTR